MAAKDEDEREQDKIGPGLPSVMGILIVAVATAACLWVYNSSGPVGPDEVWWLVRFWTFIAIVGFTLVGLGAYIYNTLKTGAVFYRMTFRDYGTTALQLAPSAALAALGNTLTSDFGWWSLGLGTAVSVLLVRKQSPKPTAGP